MPGRLDSEVGYHPSPIVATSSWIGHGIDLQMKQPVGDWPGQSVRSAGPGHRPTGSWKGRPWGKADQHSQGLEWVPISLGRPGLPVGGPGHGATRSPLGKSLERLYWLIGWAVHRHPDGHAGATEYESATDAARERPPPCQSPPLLEPPKSLDPQWPIDLRGFQIILFLDSWVLLSFCQKLKKSLRLNRRSLLSK